MSVSDGWDGQVRRVEDRPTVGKLVRCPSSPRVRDGMFEPAPCAQSRRISPSPSRHRTHLHMVAEQGPRCYKAAANNRTQLGGRTTPLSAHRRVKARAPGVAGQADAARGGCRAQEEARTGGCRAQEDAARNTTRTGRCCAQEDAAHRRMPRAGGSAHWRIPRTGGRRAQEDATCARPDSLMALQQLDIAGRAHDAAQPGHICASWQNKDFAAVL